MIFIVTVLNFKDLVDLPKWRPLSIPTAFAFSTDAGFGRRNSNALVCDFRNNEDRHPFIFHFAHSATNTGVNRVLSQYNAKNDEWETLTSGGAIIPVGTQFNGMFLMSAQGPRGTIAAGATTTSIPLTTALPATVGVNQLANRGDGRGFKVRIIGNAAGSSGRTEERLVVANTGQTTTPTLLLDSALSFTPIAGDRYEFLSGRLYILNDNATRAYDILTNSISAIANPGFGFDSVALVGLDELFVPHNRGPNEGFFGILIATATAAASLTGQAVGGDAGVVANQYRNFQIRIIQDTAIPTAVGQRRNITSHTAGPSPVYTVPAWTVTPSATAQYVIENNGDRIIAFEGGTTNTRTYTISTDTWDTNVTFSAKPGGTTNGAGVIAAQSFSIEIDGASPPNARHSFIFLFRGNGTNTLDLFDISGAATGTWTTGITYGNQSANITFLGTTTVSSITQDTATNQGRYMLINLNGTQRFYRFDLRNRILEPMTFLRIPISPPVIASSLPPPGMMACIPFIDGNTKLSFLFFNALNTANTSGLLFGLPITR